MAAIASRLLTVFESRKRAACSLDRVADLVCSRLFEIALVLVRLDHVASVAVNANHGIV
jgi:hypothetical protein